MKSKVLVSVLVCLLICTGTAFAHPFEIRPDADRPTDTQIDNFLASHPEDEWDVRGIQYYHQMPGWRFSVYAFPVGIEDPIKIIKYTNYSEIEVGHPSGEWRFDVLRWSGEVYNNRSGEVLTHQNAQGNYSIYPPLMTPLQMAMEGAGTIMTTPVRQLAPAMMIMTVGLVGFAKGWTWLKTQLWGA